MRKLFLLVLVIAGAYYSYEHQARRSSATTNDTEVAAQAVESKLVEEPSSKPDELKRVFDSGQSNVQIQAAGVVGKILADDNAGSRHQRFIVMLKSGQTVLIAHNIDLAARVTPLAVGDRVQFSGEYEWNNQGGVVHWTHRDPSGRHAAGWIKRDGQTFQ